ncbi:Abi-alpha family protein [Saccharopolyspora sp. NPDC050642]|uniref:Abi-alpha family protein n=1 Tax=Saccharopolyspora sp. NPDC050642 TaxID=3157099 RepID=UPI0033C85715
MTEEPKPDVLGVLAGWAARAGRDVARTGLGLVRELPGGEDFERGFRTLERAVADGLRQWLDEVDARQEERAAEAPAPQREPDDEQREKLRVLMAELLERSAMSGREDARDYLHTSLLRLITPDEARILAGLSDGSAYPVVHVVERGVMGGAVRFVLRNGSTVGRAVGVALTEEVPHYLTRLHALGLVEIGPALPDVDDQYETLQTDSRVRAALNSAKATKVQRRSVRISALGTRFWQRCDPSAGDAPA